MKSYLIIRFYCGLLDLSVKCKSWKILEIESSDEMPRKKSLIRNYDLDVVSYLDFNPQNQKISESIYSRVKVSQLADVSVLVP